MKKSLYAAAAVFCGVNVCYAGELALDSLKTAVYPSILNGTVLPASPAMTVPAAGSRQTNSINTGREAAIMALSDAALAAATPDQKMEMLGTLIKNSNFIQQNSDGWAKREQDIRERTIARILASAPDAASFDRMYYRLPRHTALSYPYAHFMKAILEKSRAAVVPGDWDGLSSYIDTVTDTRHSGRNLIKFLIDGPSVIAEATKDLKAATKSIHIEMFQLQSDEVGWWLANLLAEKARGGLSVRVLLDTRGSHINNDNPEMLKLISFLRENGVTVLTKELSFTLDHIDHRKILVIDGKVGFTGGMNIGKTWQMKHHDQQTLIIGPAVGKLQEAFVERWRSAGGTIAAGEDIFPALEEYPGGAQTRVVGHIGWNDHNIKALFLRAVGTAQKSIRIANPYFTDEDIFASLCAAVRRGVRVQIILPQNNDERLVQHASRDAYPELLKAGVEIYEYKDRMAHEKVEVIDGRWATFGSSNLDARSLKFNDELNLVVTDTGVAGDIEKRLFDVDLLNSERILKYSPPIKDHLANQISSWL